MDVSSDNPTWREQEGARKGPTLMSGITAVSGAQPSTFSPTRGGEAPGVSQTPRPAALSAGSGDRPRSPAPSQEPRGP